MKRVVSPSLAITTVDDLKFTNIYILETDEGDLLKLHCFENGFTFVDLDTTCIHTPVHKYMEEAITEQLEFGMDVYEFETLTEFLEWAMERIHNEMV